MLKPKKEAGLTAPFKSLSPHLRRPEFRHHESQLLTKYVHENLRRKDMTRFRHRAPETCQ